MPDPAGETGRVDLTVFRELLAPAGRRLLRAATEAYDPKDAVALATRLRRDHPAELVAAALSQAELRRRAAAKFGPDAAVMYFTRDGLEQATTAPVAAHRARRLVSGGAFPATAHSLGAADDRVRTVVDLCCGIGGDLLALARAGLDATGVDRDPLTAAIARANLDALGLSATVEVADVETYDRGRFDAAVADPARRNARGRTFSPEDYSPPWSFVLDVLTGDACVKTAPGIPHALVPDEVEAEWVGDRGEVKEAALWSGRFRTGVRRRATVLVPGGTDAEPAPEAGAQAGGGPGAESRTSVDAHDQGADRSEVTGAGPAGSGPTAVTITDADDPGEVPVREPGAYLYEPDGAVIRAGLVTAVAALLEGGMPHPQIAYVTSDRLVPTPLATAYRVLEVFPYDLKLLRKALRARRVGTLTVKKRGLDVDPEAVRRRLLGKGDGTATLVCTRTESRAVALLVEPVPAARG